ncbi:MAG: hypothetical protein JRF46_17080 [Deltaproteobacteria bacterium]|nr:hypothetical protein [Deltaproteobacteria bacterium]
MSADEGAYFFGSGCGAGAEGRCETIKDTTNQSGKRTLKSAQLVTVKPVTCSPRSGASCTDPEK